MCKRRIVRKFQKYKNLNLKSDILFKILLIGNSGVGKSSIIIQYTENKFNERLINSIGVDFKSKKMEFNDKIVNLQIWDTAGHERFRSLTTSYYRGANAIGIVFSVDDRESFNNIDSWLKEIENHAKENVIKILVGNKCDIVNRVVSNEEGLSLAKKYKIGYIETSAKENIKTTEFFEMAVKEFLANNKNFNREIKSIDININNDDDQKKCC